MQCFFPFFISFSPPFHPSSHSIISVLSHPFFFPLPSSFFLSLLSFLFIFPLVSFLSYLYIDPFTLFVLPFLSFSTVPFLLLLFPSFLLALPLLYVTNIFQCMINFLSYTVDCILIRGRLYLSPFLSCLPPSQSACIVFSSTSYTGSCSFSCFDTAMVCSSLIGVCLSPSSPSNGVVTSTGNSVGDTATYTCNTGFELIGQAVATCTQATDGNSASFSPTQPICLRKFYHHKWYLAI